MERAQRQVARNRYLLLPMALALACGLVAWSDGALLANDAVEGTGRSTRSSRTTQKDGGKVSESKIEEKLNQILENQQKILARFDQVMEELRIVKIRATLR